MEPRARRSPRSAIGSRRRDLRLLAPLTDTATRTRTAGSEHERVPVAVVGFGRLAIQATESGWVEVAFLLISINVFVGIFNLVPLLPFDGGHIAIATYE